VAEWGDGTTRNNFRNSSGGEKGKVLKQTLKDQTDYTGGGEAATGRHCKEGSKGTLD